MIPQRMQTSVWEFGNLSRAEQGQDSFWRWERDGLSPILIYCAGGDGSYADITSSPGLVAPALWCELRFSRKLCGNPWLCNMNSSTSARARRFVLEASKVCCEDSLALLENLFFFSPLPSPDAFSPSRQWKSAVSFFSSQETRISPHTHTHKTPLLWLATKHCNGKMVWVVLFFFSPPRFHPFAYKASSFWRIVF